MSDSDNTYTARWADTGAVIFLCEKKGNLFGQLPLGTQYAPDPGTLTREDGGDPWEEARFVLGGKIITVTKDEKKKKKKKDRVITPTIIVSLIDITSNDLRSLDLSNLSGDELTLAESAASIIFHALKKEKRMRALKESD